MKTKSLTLQHPYCTKMKTLHRQCKRPSIARLLASKRSPQHRTDAPILLFDVMDTIVRDPFFHRVPAFFNMSMKEIFAAKHPTTWAEFEKGLIDETELYRRFFTDGRAINGPGMLADMVEGYEYLEGMPELLQDLKDAGVEMHAMSNYPIWYRHINHKLKLDRYLQWTFLSCEGPMKGLRKPQPECFTVALDHLDVAQPSQLVLIDDRSPNVDAATAAGLRTILFQDAHALKGELQQLGLL